ncbi:serine--tRNA ligase [Miltoncostaea marina]|uniref:serine--tRNA ligase n=1 Tax=Miltoncostaea marina TaxID=2843215 RepID=UPI001C3CFB5B|nr:serine--tRNA ligase [Miltoncostaea marina]
MLDLRLIRADTERVAAGLARRGEQGALGDLLAADEAARALRTAVEATRAERTRISKAVGQARRAGEDSAALEADARRLGDDLARQEEELRELEGRRDAILAGLPNLAEDAAPDGGEEDSVELRRVGEPPAFGFAPRDHLELGAAAGVIDMESAARVSGARFAYLLGPLVRLQLALVGLALDRLEAEGFTPVIPPVLVREEAMYGTGFFPTDRASIYRTADDDLYLVGTSEVPLAGLHGDQILAEDDLPLRYGGLSTCFRREAGAAGRDTRGIFRVHQFDKVEMFSFVLPEHSAEEHLRILGVQEAILQAIEVPYRVVDIAVGDLGASAARKFDCEAWMPAQGAYREVTSCSNCTDYQARRLRARVKRATGTEPVHTLNGTAVAVGRTIIAILENHQREDGSVAVPAALVANGAPEEIRPR